MSGNWSPFDLAALLGGGAPGDGVEARLAEPDVAQVTGRPPDVAAVEVDVGHQPAGVDGRDSGRSTSNPGAPAPPLATKAKRIERRGGFRGRLGVGLGDPQQDGAARWRCRGPRCRSSSPLVVGAAASPR